MSSVSPLFYRDLSGDDARQCLKFKEIANEIAALAATVNITVIPFRHENLEHFLKLDSQGRTSVLKTIEIYLNVYKAVQAEGSSLLDSVRVIWNALVGLGFRPTSDLFNYIKTGNVIEIHDDQLVQVFRNFAFFNFCSYSLEELYCYRLTDLYSREDSVNQDLIGYLQRLYSGSVKTVLPINLKPHIISELISNSKLKIYDQVHYMAPLFSTESGGAPVATITIESANINYEALVSEVQNQPAVEELAIVFEFRPRVSLHSDPST